MRLFEKIYDYRNALRAVIGNSRRNKIFILAQIIYSRMFFGIGPLYYSLFLLHQKPVRVWSEYILDKEANAIDRTLSLPAARQLVRDKLRFSSRLNRCNFPTIPVLAVIAKSPESVEAGFATVWASADFLSLAQKLPDEVFFKTIDGGHGDGAFVASRHQRQWTFCGRTAEASELFLHCLEKLGDRSGWIIQPRIRSHASISILAPHALGTVRIVTALSGGTVAIVAAVLKIPVGKNVTDNFSEGATGNIVAPIELQSGRLGMGQMSKNHRWPEIVSVDRHPDTAHKIAGVELPHWRETVALVTNMQREIKEAPTLGWDIALTDTGPLVVEANCGYGVEIHQVAEQIGMRSTFVSAWNSVRAASD